MTESVPSDRRPPSERPTPSDPSDRIQVVFLSWDDESARRHFVIRVFSLLTVMLTMVTGMGAVTVFWEPARAFFQTHWYIGLMASLFFLVIYFVLMCFHQCRRRFPLNLILLTLLTLTLGLVVMSNCAWAMPIYVVLIFAVTVICCLGIMAFAVANLQIDGWLFVGFAAGLSFVTYTVAAVVISCFSRVHIWNLLICGFFCVLYMTFLALNTRSIVRGRQRGLQVQPDEIVLGAVVLFVDIVHIFLCLLGVGGGGHD